MFYMISPEALSTNRISIEQSKAEAIFCSSAIVKLFLCILLERFCLCAQLWNGFKDAAVIMKWPESLGSAHKGQKMGRGKVCQQ